MWRVCATTRLAWNPELRFAFIRLLTTDTQKYDLSAHNAGVREAADWCMEQFGPRPVSHIAPGIRWGVVGSEIRFRHQVDATAFRLRWC